MSTVTLRDKVTDLLQRLIRIDTTNPPGNETAAAELLRDYLEANGLDCELIAKVPERANLVARLPGGDGPSLLFLGHTDVVLADPAEWSVPPFSGELRDGHVWGRGALDMKSEVAANAVAIASLAREGFRPSGDLIFAATADEEAGAGFGLEWLCEAHPDAVRCDFAINEGGGDRIELEDGRPIYLPTVAEKMTAPFRLTVRGRSGHASMPGIADNALVNAVPLIERIAALPAGAAARAGGRRLPSGGARGGDARGPGGRARRGVVPGGRGPRRRAARADVLADGDLGVEEAERHPRPLRDRGRLPAPAGPASRARRADDPRSARG